MKKPFTHFDSPTFPLYDGHHIAARARQADEIERRRALPTGTIVLEQQHGGLQVASLAIDYLEDDNDLLYMTDILAATGLNTGHYLSANPEVMRRRHILPELANDSEGFRETRQGLLLKARMGLFQATETAAYLANSHAEGRLSKQKRIQFGRSLGTLSLALAAIKLGDAPAEYSAFTIQDTVRRTSLQSMDTARQLVHSIGTNPSYVQLADADSDLSVHIRRTAPNGAREALIAAQESRTT